MPALVSLRGSLLTTLLRVFDVAAANLEKLEHV